tara:strand:+ start:375 stop:635 length:261 start_codon:yes stop_codon:yes gene_type:complete
MKKRITEIQILKNSVVQAYAKINEDIQDLQKQINTLNTAVYKTNLDLKKLSVDVYNVDVKVDNNYHMDKGQTSRLREPKTMETRND